MAASKARTELTYRACSATEDFAQCLKLQKTIWRFDDVDVVPLPVFVVCGKIGGHVFGAFEPSGRMVGFCLAMPGLRAGKSFLHSHMLAVLPEYQNRGVGRALKMMQSADAMERGVGLIEWTFDPLELKNAFFNLEKLGAIVRRYVPNQYGMMSSALQGGLPSDRLVAEWRVGRPRRRPAAAGALRIELPTDIGEIKTRDRAAALAVQARAREQFQQAFREGWVAAGFERGEKQSAYLLEKICEPDD